MTAVQNLINHVTYQTTLHSQGNASILQQRILGLLCSVQCPGSIVIQTFDVIRELRDAGIVIAGGFHSPTERECLDFLLRGTQPVIVCLAKGLGKLRLPAAWRKALDAGRLLLVSPFAETVHRTTQAQAHRRNQYITSISSTVLIPHASPGGKTEALAREVIASGKPVYTFDVADNAGLLEMGAKRYDLGEIDRLIHTAG